MIVAVFIVLLQSTPLSDTENSLSSVFFYTIVFVWWLTKNTALVSCSLWAKYLEELMSSKQATNTSKYLTESRIRKSSCVKSAESAQKFHSEILLCPRDSSPIFLPSSPNRRVHEFIDLKKYYYTMHQK